MTICIKPPQFVTLAPQQMAEKYNKAVEEILLLTDFELMVDQEVLTRRKSMVNFQRLKLATTSFTQMHVSIF
jgi:hypothetical protein